MTRESERRGCKKDVDEREHNGHEKQCGRKHALHCEQDVGEEAEHREQLQRARERASRIEGIMRIWASTAR